MFKIEMLDANEGDALWIEYGPSDDAVKRLLIDCGRSNAYEAVRQRLDDATQAGTPLDFELFILTHVDEDHIYGSIKLIADQRLQPDQVGDVWFNGYAHMCGEKVEPNDDLGARQGEYFGAVLRDRRFRWNAEFAHRAVVAPPDGPLPSVTLPGGMKLTLLSPTWPRLEHMRQEWYDELASVDEDDERYIAPGDWERALEVLTGETRLHPDAMGADWVQEWDPSEFDSYAGSMFSQDPKAPNGSSIAVLAEFDGRSALLTGDAWPSVLIESLKRLKTERGINGQIPIDIIKLPHHGSKGNINADLVSMVQCNKWLVSTNAKKHHHPNAEAIARVIDGSSHPTIYFNHVTDESRVWDDGDLREAHGYETEYGTAGHLTVEV